MTRDSARDGLPAPVERGSSTVELVLLAPLLGLVLMFVAACGRTVSAAMTVRSAADSAARSATIVSRSRMVPTGRDVAMRALTAPHSSCSGGSVTVDVHSRSGLSFVTVTARCAVDRNGVGSLIPAGKILSATSTEVIDVFTFR